MRRLGTVVSTVGGVAVARSHTESPPELGTAVVDEHLSTVGRVVDVMGPVDQPYLVISTEDSPTVLLNEPLYAR